MPTTKKFGRRKDLVHLRANFNFSYFFPDRRLFEFLRVNRHPIYKIDLALQPFIVGMCDSISMGNQRTSHARIIS